MRTIIEVPDDVIEAFDKMSGAEKRSRSSLIREAITEYLHNKTLPPAEVAFGLWKSDPKDGVAYQNDLRAEWSHK